MKEESPPVVAASKPAQPTTSTQRTVGTQVSLHFEGHIRKLKLCERPGLKNEPLVSIFAVKPKQDSHLHQ